MPKAPVLDDGPSAAAAGGPPLAPPPDEVVQLLAHWVSAPVAFVTGVLGAVPDPWQCDVLDCLADPAVDRVALRSCHGPGKTTLEAWAVLWFTLTRPFSRVPTTAPTFHRQVRDLLWAEIARWWRTAERAAPWLTAPFALSTTRLQHRTHSGWYAVGVASREAVNMEGYHARYILVVFDEAKGIRRPAWDAARGMLTNPDLCTACGRPWRPAPAAATSGPAPGTARSACCGAPPLHREVKHLVASTPGGKLGEFYRVFSQYRTTWRHLFVIHPRALQGHPRLAPEVVGRHPVTGEPTPGAHARGGTYYSDRVSAQWVETFREELGEDNPVYIAKVMGEFPEVEGDVLLPVSWLERAVARQRGAPGPRVVAVDVARYGRDRTVFLVGEGGTLLHGVTTGRYAAETTLSAGERQELDLLAAQWLAGPGAARRPAWRSTVATALIARRLLTDYGAERVIVDETGVGGGVSDLLQAWGVPVDPVNFGAAPTDRPLDPAQREWLARRGRRDTVHANLKAQMGLALQRAFGAEAIALGPLPPAIRDPLVAQASRVGIEVDALGRLRLVDPDETEDESFAGSAETEGRRSPDHFHALLLYWWAAGRAAGRVPPRVRVPEGNGAAAPSSAGGPVVPPGVAQVGRPTVGGLGGPSARPAPRAARVGGQAAWLQGRYR